MRPKRNLGLLFLQFERRNARLRKRVEDLHLRNNVEVDALITAAVIDAQGSWSSFLRAYYVSSIYSATCANLRVSNTAALSTENAALRAAFSVYHRRPFTGSVFTKRDDPPWHDLKFYKKLFAYVGASNAPKVTNAFSYTTNYLSLLPTARNFYAHRCDETLKKLQQLPIKVGFIAVKKLHPTEVMKYRTPGGHHNVITDWLYDMDSVADLMCN